MAGSGLGEEDSVAMLRLFERMSGGVDECTGQGSAA
jgi:hypothetical protein